MPTAITRKLESRSIKRHLKKIFKNVQVLTAKIENIQPKNRLENEFSEDTLAYLRILNLIAKKKVCLPPQQDNANAFVQSLLKLLFESMGQSSSNDTDLENEIPQQIKLALHHSLMPPINDFELIETPDLDEVLRRESSSKINRALDVDENFIKNVQQRKSRNSSFGVLMSDQDSLQSTDRSLLADAILQSTPISKQAPRCFLDAISVIKPSDESVENCRQESPNNTIVPLSQNHNDDHDDADDDDDNEVTVVAAKNHDDDNTIKQIDNDMKKQADQAKNENQNNDYGKKAQTNNKKTKLNKNKKKNKQNRKNATITTNQRTDDETRSSLMNTISTKSRNYPNPELNISRNSLRSAKSAIPDSVLMGEQPSQIFREITNNKTMTKSMSTTLMTTKSLFTNERN